jgi:signal transduction histidine kinase
MNTSPWLAAAVYLLPTIVWGILADDAWRFRLGHRPQAPMYRLLPLFTTTMAALYGTFLLAALLLPPRSFDRAPRWFDLTDVALLLALAQMRHIAWYFRLDAPRPSRLWLAVNYVPAVVLATVNLFPELVPAPSEGAQMTIARAPLGIYVPLMIVLTLLQLRRFARPGRWWAAGTSVVRGGDLVVVAAAFVAAVLLFAALSLETRSALGGTVHVGYVQVAAVPNAIIGLLITLPFAVRILGDVVKRLLFAVVVLIAVGSSYAAGVKLAGLAAPALRDAIVLLAVAGSVLSLLAVQRSVWSALDWLIFRRGQARRTELRAFMQTLSPDLGAAECCRRALAEVLRLMQLRGGAVLLTGDRGVVVQGDIDVDPLLAVWRDARAVELLPPRPFSIGKFRELPLEFQEALIETDVVGVMPITSPRQRWGAGFVTAGPLTTFSEEDREAIRAHADQLALVLDASELLERAVGVERSLAHAEKLAAIGELAARIAHEIRNPVTAARSLAQQLARDPTSPYNAEHAELILTELHRVEQQVASLLRFARREEFVFEPVELGDLVRSTVADLHDRLAAASVDCRVSSNGHAVARADHEKMRQVLVNLVDNAVDALAHVDHERRLSIIVGRDGTLSTIDVADNGPGVEADALARLFEPFFSQKPNGTGLGLAIVKRIVEGHGGRITAAPGDGSGLAFHLEVPLA